MRLPALYGDSGEAVRSTRDESKRFYTGQSVRLATYSASDLESSRLAGIRPFISVQSVDAPLIYGCGFSYSSAGIAIGRINGMPDDPEHTIGA
jgi:hypothetical protein